MHRRVISKGSSNGDESSPRFWPPKMTPHPIPTTSNQAQPADIVSPRDEVEPPRPVVASASGVPQRALRRFSTELRAAPVAPSGTRRAPDAAGLESAFSELEIQSDDVKATFMDLLEEAGPDLAARSAKAAHVLEKVGRVEAMASNILEKAGVLDQGRKEQLSSRFAEVRRLIADAAKATTDDPDAVRIIVAEKLGIVEEMIENLMRSAEAKDQVRSAAAAASAGSASEGETTSVPLQEQQVSKEEASINNPRSTVQDLFDLDPWLKPYQWFLEKRLVSL